MTVIVAAVTEDRGVVMAADQEVSGGWQKSLLASPKLWVDGQSVIGAAGELRMAQVLKHHVTWPKFRPNEDTDVEAWLIRIMIPAIRNGVDGHGIVKNSSGVESLGGSLIYATGDHLAEIDSYCGVLTVTAGRLAIGSGYAEALGRLGDRGPWTEDDVVDAARRATQSARGCGGAISVVDTRNLTIRTVGA